MLQPLLRPFTRLLLLLATATPLAAQSPLHTIRVATGLSEPVYATAPVGDFNRLFIVEQGSPPIASVRVLDISANPPQLQAAPYLSVGPIYVGGESGLLGLAFHPGFASNGYLFVFYNDAAGDIQIVRYQALAPYMSSIAADLSSATPVLGITHGMGGHNGGWIGFGPDGFLYIDIGDGTHTNAQDLTKLHGKVLRIDVDGDDFPSDPTRNYAIPASNPFYGSTTAQPEIWAYGLRNPWRASFDRVTGDMWIGDVGNGAIEEIDFAPAGASALNFGWDCMEGPNCTGYTGCTCNDLSLTLPVHSYPHTAGNFCVIGGYRYRGSALCGFDGVYFYGDYNQPDRIWTFEWDGSSIQNLTYRASELDPGPGLYLLAITSFGEDAAGELYVVSHIGDVFKIVPGTITDCNGNGVHDGCDIAGGSSADLNSNGVPDECEPIGTPGCFGDGSTATACPCANIGAPGHGCENSAATGGARLEGVGSQTADDVALVSSGELPSALTIFLQGNLLTANGVVFGDGVRCTSGALKRLYSNSASAGSAHAPQVGDPSITARSAQLGDPLLPLSGQVRYYQAYYRDPSPTFCAAPAGNTWNISSLLAITW